MALNIKYLGLTDYKTCWLAMKAHIENNPQSDEIWVTEHNPIYKTGLNKKNFKLPNSSIPHLFVDRGGKITFHGPGQIIFYFSRGVFFYYFIQNTGTMFIFGL